MLGCFSLDKAVIGARSGVVYYGEFHVRVSVWPVDSVTASSASAPGPDNCPPSRYGHLLKAARISPHAVEIRTPVQVHQHVYGNGVAV